MKRILLLILILSSFVYAQEEVWTSNLLLRPNPTPYFDDWEYDPNIAEVQVFLSNTDETGYFKFRTTITGESRGRVIYAVSLLHEIEPNIMTSFRNTDFVEWNDVEYNDDFNELIERTGRIPEDNYELCIEIITPNERTVLTEICSDFAIEYTEPPSLILPNNEDDVSNTLLNFSWTPVISAIDVNYNIKLCEINPLQTPRDAIEGNTPIIDYDLGNVNTYLYGIDDPELDITQKFVWQVQATNSSGYPIGLNNGKSEIFIFTVYNNDSIPDDDSDEDTDADEEDEDDGDIDDEDDGDEDEDDGDIVDGDEDDDEDIDDIPDSTPGDIRLNHIHGYVFDYETDEPVPGARIIYKPVIHSNSEDEDDEPIRTLTPRPGSRPATPGTPPKSGRLTGTGESDSGSGSGSGKNKGRLSDLLITDRYIPQDDSIVVFTSVDGEFIINNVSSPGYYYLSIDKMNYHNVTYSGEEYSISNNIDNRDFFIQPNFGSIQGVVRDNRTNEPMAHQYVRLYRYPTTAELAINSGVMDPVGVNGIDVGDLIDGIGGSHWDIGDGLGEMDITDRVNRHEYEVDEYGNIIPHRTEEVAELAGAYSIGISDMILVSSATTDENGEYSFENVSSTRYKIAISSEIYFSHISGNLQIEEGEDFVHDINLEPKLGRIIISVKDNQSRIPIPGVKVAVFEYTDSSVFDPTTLPGTSGVSDDFGTPNMRDLYERAGEDGIEIIDIFDTELTPLDSSIYMVTGEYNIGEDWLYHGDFYDLEFVGEWDIFPPTMPEIDPFVPVRYTPNSGLVDFAVPINNPVSPSKKYVIWSHIEGYEDQWMYVRLTEADERGGGELLMNRIPPGITGSVLEANTLSPISMVRVELKDRVTVDGVSQLVTKHVTYTNNSGNYVFYDVVDLTYEKITFIKNGYWTSSIEEPIDVDYGELLRIDHQMHNNSGFIKGYVIDPTDRQIPDATVRVLGNPINVRVGPLGEYLIPVQPGEVVIKTTAPDFHDHYDTVSCNLNDTLYHVVRMEPYMGNARILTKDSKTNAIIKAAKIILDDEEVGVTNKNGFYFISNIDIGRHDLTILTPDNKSYIPYVSNLNIEPDSTLELVIELREGATVTGKVKSSNNNPLMNVEVELPSAPLIKAKTDFEGTYVLRGVPNGEFVIQATKSGYFTGYRNVNVTKAELVENIDIILEDSPIDEIYGFNVLIDSLILLDNGNNIVWGEIDIRALEFPDFPAVALTDFENAIPFSGIELNSDGIPVEGLLNLDIDEIDIAVWGFPARISTPGGLAIGYDTDLGTGYFIGDIVFPMEELLSEIPGVSWEDMKIPKLDNYRNGALREILSLTSTGQNYLIEPLHFMSCEENDHFELWGFELEIDCERTSIDLQGMTFSGRLIIPDFNDIIIERLVINSDLEIYEIILSTDPPIEYETGVFRLELNSLSWTQAGLDADGIIQIETWGRSLGFQDLNISCDGRLLGCSIDLPDNYNFEFFGNQMFVENMGFSTDNLDMKYLIFSGDLDFDIFDQRIGFNNIRLSANGNLSGSIEPNISLEFMDFIDVDINEVYFSRVSGDYNLNFESEVSLDIPGVSITAGDFTFFEDGRFTLSELGFGFSAGPCEVELHANWSSDILSGGGRLRVSDYFNAGADFRYGPDTWWIKVRAGVVIPVGPIVIREIVGELGHSRGIWTFGFGGMVTLPAAEVALKLDSYITVESGHRGGPIITGEADLIVFSDFNVGHAEFTLNFPRSYFAGSGSVGFNKMGLSCRTEIALEIMNDDWWYINGNTNMSFIGMSQAADIWIGNNYDGFRHESNIAGYPSNRPLNGFIFEFSGGDGWSGPIYVNYDVGAYIALDPARNAYSGGIRLDAVAGIDALLAGAEASGSISVGVGYENCAWFYGSARAGLRGYVGNCGRNECGTCWCCAWKLCSPCGYQLCGSVTLKAMYNARNNRRRCGSGWNWDYD